MLHFGPWEIILIILTILLIFGPRKLPELGRGIGAFFKNLKKSFKDNQDKE